MVMEKAMGRYGEGEEEGTKYRVGVGWGRGSLLDCYVTQLRVRLDYNTSILQLHASHSIRSTYPTLSSLPLFRSGTPGCTARDLNAYDSGFHGLEIAGSPSQCS